MERPALFLLAFSLALGPAAGFLFDIPRIFGDDATGYGPVFEEQPQDLIYPEESADTKISMNCRARANPPAKYTWRLNNWELKLLEQPDEHYSLVGGNLVITNPIKGRHGGRYVCVASNVYGMVYSKEAIVQFGYLEDFSVEEREAVPAKEGQGVVLLCAPPPHYPDDLTFRWILNELPYFILPDKRRFVSQRTGNLYISKVELSDSGNYSCFVSSPSIAKSVYSQFIPLVPSPESPARKYPADIRLKLPDTTALLGQNITLECFALGNPIPEIRWRKVDAELPASHEIGMSGSLLHLYNVQYEDEGSYECEALNTKGKDWHRIWLYVEAAPEWASHINNTEKDIGSELTLSCQANAKPWVYIRWLKDGYSYGKGELKFSSLTFADSGMYQCIAENRYGIIYANAELRVIACAPTFEKNPVRKTLLGARKGRVVIECKPRAAPKPKIIWSKGTEQLRNSSRLRVWDDGSLEILNATRQDEGTYTCFAENDRGKANSSGVLTIVEATKITTAPDYTEVTVGETARMACAASHDPSLDVTFVWSVDTHVIDFERETEHYQRVTAYQSSGELRIRNTQLKHAGHYTCTAQTIVDNATASADLTVRGPPGPPGGLRVEDYKAQTARLVWSRGADHHSPILRYTIQARDSLSLDWEVWRNITTAPPILEGMAEMANLVDLTPWTEYEFRVIATNALGMGEPSVPAPKIRTWEAVPTVPPTDVGGGGGMSKELTVTWTPVPREFYFGRNFGYVVAFKRHDYLDWKWATVADPEARRYVYKDASIVQVTEYQVKVRPYNSQGEGPYSLTAVIYTALDVPTEAPADVGASALTSTDALVWWLPVFQQPVDGYQIRYWRKYYDNEAAANRLFLNRTMENQTRLSEILPYWHYRVEWRYYNEAWIGTRLENMLPDSHYMVEVRAYNDAGFGPPGEICEMFTKKPPPDRPPRLVRYYDLFRTYLYITWTHVEPMYNESRIEGYKVMIKKEGHFRGKLMLTGRHYMFMAVPSEGDLLVEVRARSEGGDGPISRIRISAGAVLGAQSLGVVPLLLVGLCSLSL
ncbi:contactin 1b isoform X2 [Anguilla anguilla]|nr:contactin 1b isoform X2 [Anguilla anguilla]XP_035258168.1 contactin 1b isoform X2 [Anguilla anguilla]XP_035258169.1 contactin 1b isoform X2 [Anguilla anguilla]